MKRLGFSEENLNEVEELIQEMKEDNEKIPILVEGRRDKEVLRNLGFEGEIITINLGKTLTDLSDFIASKYNEIIVLTDWDKKGSYLAGKLYTLLRDNDVLCNMEYRKKLGFYLGSHISTVEELSLLL